MNGRKTAIVAVAVIISACSQAPPPSHGPPPSTAPGPAQSHRVSARDLLLSQQTEEPGYGLYSYVLFSAPPAPGSPQLERARAALAVFLSMPQKTEVQRQIDTQNINLTYLPVKEPLTRSDVDAQLSAYDYARAQVYLARLGRKHGGGPVLVSTLVPLSSRQPVDATRLIYQDLSTVPPKVAGLWMEHFLTQAEQERFWERLSREEFILGLRTFIARGGDETSQMGTALASIIWIGKR